MNFTYFKTLASPLLGLIFFSNMSTAEPKSIDFSGMEWQLKAENAVIETYKDKKAVLLTKGSMALPDVGFKNGIIEYDIAFSEERGFHGVQFRADTNQYEIFYLRPHQSGNPDASQYTPVFNGISNWQLYHGDGFSAAMNFDFDEWMHVKLVVLGDRAEVYIEDMSKPALLIHELKLKAQSGGIKLSAGMAPVRYANFSVKQDDNVKLVGETKSFPDAPEGTVLEWKISNVFDGDILENKTALNKKDLKELTWSALKTEASGLANLARIQGKSEKENTTFVKTTINAKNSARRKMALGYSDMATVFLNGKALYLGQNKFQSRDYRYLGTIGFFDTVFLELKKGDNELIIAVAENFGGWGVQAKFENPDGLTFK